MTGASGGSSTPPSRWNVAILGDTGVGKSALVNAIFGDERAPSGIGAPITEGAVYYLSDHAALGVWDFWGFEHGSEVAPVRELRDRIREIQSGNPERAINVAWFCWDASNPRVTDGHRALIKVVREAGIPLIGVLTKVLKQGQATKQEHQEFGRWIEGEDLGFASEQVHLTAVIEDKDFGVEAHGLGKLLQTSLKHAAPPVVPQPSRRDAVAARLDSTQKAAVRTFEKRARTLGRAAKSVGKAAKTAGEHVPRPRRRKRET